MSAFKPGSLLEQSGHVCTIAGTVGAFFMVDLSKLALANTPAGIVFGDPFFHQFLGIAMLCLILRGASIPVSQAVRGAARLAARAWQSISAASIWLGSQCRAVRTRIAVPTHAPGDDSVICLGCADDLQAATPYGAPVTDPPSALDPVYGIWSPSTRADLPAIALAA